MEDKIQNLYNFATEAELKKGKTWYWNAHNWCVDRELEFRVPYIKVGGVLSLLSPLQNWERNKINTIKMLSCGDCNYFSKQKAKAKLLLSNPYLYQTIDEIRLFINGQKTSNFFMNIVQPFNPEYITIDKHMIDILMPGKHITYDRYLEMTKSITNHAAELSIVPNQLQAILWVTHKRIKQDGKN